MWAAGLGAGLVGGALSYFGAREANQATAKMSREQMDFQERMSNTQYQRAVSDMEAAGLNPMLAFQQGGAGTPQGAQAQMQNEWAPAVSNAREAMMMSEQVKNIKAQNAKILAETSLTRQMERVSEQEAVLKKLSAQGLKYDLTGKKVESDIDSSKPGEWSRWLQRFIPGLNWLKK